MDLQRFEMLAEAWGADLARWPQPERDAAEVFAGMHPDVARRVLAQAGTLDAALDAARDVQAGDLLAARIRRAAPKPARTLVWRGAMAASLALAVGLGAGYAGAAAAASDVDSAYFTGVFGDLDADWAEWTENGA
ncbi:MAG: hypothetical protein KIS81_09600 [Maricaulaceae bacterium]|nr:hypothetical protein [Maricaulaceae bacterium]